MRRDWRHLTTTILSWTETTLNLLSEAGDCSGSWPKPLIHRVGWFIARHPSGTNLHPRAEKKVLLLLFYHSYSTGQPRIGKPLSGVVTETEFVQNFPSLQHSADMISQSCQSLWGVSWLSFPGSLAMKLTHRIPVSSQEVISSHPHCWAVYLLQM